MTSDIKADAIKQQTNLYPGLCPPYQKHGDFIADHVTSQKETAQVQRPGGATYHVAQGLQCLATVLVNCELLISGDLRQAHGSSKLPALRR